MLKDKRIGNPKPANEFHSYMKGWGDGAGHKGIDPKFKDHATLSEFYMQGWTDGRAAFNKAGAKAAAVYKYTPTILRAMGAL